MIFLITIYLCTDNKLYKDLIVDVMKELLGVKLFPVVPFLNQNATVAQDFFIGAEKPFSYLSCWEVQSLNALAIGTHG